MRVGVRLSPFRWLDRNSWFVCRNCYDAPWTVISLGRLWIEWSRPEWMSGPADGERDRLGAFMDHMETGP